MKLQLNWGKVLEDLTHRGLKVFLYCWFHREQQAEWKDTAFTKWLGSDFKKGSSTWEDGIKNLVMQGYIVKKNEGWDWNKKKLLELFKSPDNG